MDTVHRLNRDHAAPPLGDAVRAFRAEVASPNTRRAYGTALRALLAELGESRPVAALDEEGVVDRLGGWFADRWDAAAPATANARLDALRSAADWWRDKGWLAGDPLRRVRRRPRP